MCLPSSEPLVAAGSRRLHSAALPRGPGHGATAVAPPSSSHALASAGGVPGRAAAAQGATHGPRSASRFTSGTRRLRCGTSLIPSGTVTVSVLVVEDDAALRRVIARLLAASGCVVDECDDGAEAASLVARAVHDVVLLDLGLPGKSGLDILRDRPAASRRPAIVVLSGSDDSTATIEAMRHGAYDFLVKPPDLDEVRATVIRAAGMAESGGDAASLPSEDEHGVLVGRTPAMREVFKLIGRVAATRVTVLINGESGTGKELVARAIHEASPNPRAPFIAVNCAALSAGLLESELFGHTRGAFTGAVADRAGRFEMAGEGTILLDEIGELDPALQAKLLRVLEQRRFERVGSTEVLRMQARVIAATNQDLVRAVAEGRFREDLLHRLEVVRIDLPPLRERVADIPILVERLCDRIASELGMSVTLGAGAMAALQNEPWPGNVRQLYNALQRAALVGQGVIMPEGLKTGASANGVPERATAPTHRASGPVRSLDDVERDHIAATLRRFGWHKRRSAEALGISRVTLDRKIARYGLTQDEESPS
jgi:two-component system response regulator AtoC